MSRCLAVLLRKLRKTARRYGYRGLKIFTSLSLRFQDFQRGINCGAIAFNSSKNAHTRVTKNTFPGSILTKIDDNNNVFDDIFNAEAVILEENEASNIPTNPAREFLFEALRWMRTESSATPL